MKATVLAAAAAVLAGGASAASRHGHRHAHALFEKKSDGAGKECVESCTTIYSTVTGEPTRRFCRQPSLERKEETG